MTTPGPSRLPTHVDISGLALLQITKHCQESMPNLATGMLLGMEKNGVLEVTYTFPTPNAATNGDDTDSTLNTGHEAVDPVKYSEDMLKNLRDVNVDNNNMGFYRSSQGLGGFIDKQFVEEMVEYHRAIRNSFVIVFDPWFSQKGSLMLKAYRLRDEFYRVYQTQTFNQATFNSLGQSTILEEIPIIISNSPLASVYLWDLQDGVGDNTVDCDFERLNLSANDSLEKQLTFMSACVEDLVKEQDNIASQQKRINGKKRELARKQAEQAARQAANLSTSIAPTETIRPPNRLQSLLVSSRINNYCQQINAFTDDSFTRLFLASSVQKETTA
jgi:translation initiation factor 3 subunit H